MAWHIRLQQGPWRILTHCKASSHNTFWAARSHPIGFRCICPRAIALVVAKIPRGYPDIGIPYFIADDCTARRHNIPAAWTGRDDGDPCTCPGSVTQLEAIEKRKSGKNKKHNLIKQERDSLRYVGLRRTEDMGDALCRKLENLPIVDGGFTDEVKGREDAKALCVECPLMHGACARLLQHEYPAGAWGGVYAGRDIYDRRNEAPPHPKPMSLIAVMRTIDASPEIKVPVKKTGAVPRPHAGIGHIRAGGYARMSGTRW